MTERDINIMDEIQRQKEKDIDAAQLQPLDPEGDEMAKGKRFTLDIIDAPTDPLR